LLKGFPGWPVSTNYGEKIVANMPSLTPNQMSTTVVWMILYIIIQLSGRYITVA